MQLGERSVRPSALAFSIYAVGLLAGVGAGVVLRRPAAPLFLFWAALCEWTGVLVVAALAGWMLRRWAGAESAARATRRWFPAIQAVMVVSASLAVGWVSFDHRFNELGQGIALLGLDGRRAGIPSALMLLGASILMAWQTEGEWRKRWQFTSMATGLLFTTSISWSNIAADSSSIGFDRALTLAVTASMMTMMSGWGLGRGLPRNSDWLQRGKEASLFFAILGASMLLTAVALW